MRISKLFDFIYQKFVEDKVVDLMKDDKIFDGVDSEICYEIKCVFDLLGLPTKIKVWNQDKTEAYSKISKLRSLIYSIIKITKHLKLKSRINLTRIFNEEFVEQQELIPLYDFDVKKIVKIIFDIEDGVELEEKYYQELKSCLILLSYEFNISSRLKLLIDISDKLNKINIINDIIFENPKLESYKFKFEDCESDFRKEYNRQLEKQKDNNAVLTQFQINILVPTTKRNVEVLKILNTLYKLSKKYDLIDISYIIKSEKLNMFFASGKDYDDLEIREFLKEIFEKFENLEFDESIITEVKTIFNEVRVEVEKLNFELLELTNIKYDGTKE